MTKLPIYVVLPASFVDECSAKGVNVEDALSVTYNDARVSFKVDVVPDDYFSEFYS